MLRPGNLTKFSAAESRKLPIWENAPRAVFVQRDTGEWLLREKNKSFHDRAHTRRNAVEGENNDGESGGQEG